MTLFEAQMAFTVSSPSDGGQSTTMWENLPRTVSSALVRPKTRFLSLSSLTSAATRSALAGSTARCWIAVRLMIAGSVLGFKRAS